MSSISQCSQVTFVCFVDMWVYAVYSATTWTCGHCTSSIQVLNQHWSAVWTSSGLSLSCPYSISPWCELHWCQSVVWTSAVVELEYCTSVGRAFQHCSGIHPPWALSIRTWLQWFLTTVPQLCKGISSLSPEDIGAPLRLCKIQCVRLCDRVLHKGVASCDQVLYKGVAGHVIGYCAIAW